MKSPRGEWEYPTVVQPLNDLFHFPDLGREWFCIVHCIMELVERRCRPGGGGRLQGIMGEISLFG